MNDELRESRDLFLGEAGDYLELLNSELLKLEKMTEREKETESLNNMFRAAHSIKGMSGMLGFTKINRLTHKMENILDNIRQGRMDFTDEAVETLFMCFDLLTALIGAISMNEPEEESADIEDAVRSIEDLIAGIHSQKGNVPGGSTEGQPSVTISLSLSGAVRESLQDFEDLNLFIAERSPDNIFEVVFNLYRVCCEQQTMPDELVAGLREIGDVVHMTPKMDLLPDISSESPEALDIDVYVVLQTRSSAGGIEDKLGIPGIEVRDLRVPDPSVPSVPLIQPAQGAVQDKSAVPVVRLERSSYIGVFIDESNEEIEKMNEALLALEKSPGDSEHFNTIMRVMHSLKSSSAAVGFNNVSSLAHVVESLLVSFRTRNIIITSEHITLLLKTIDRVRNVLAEARAGGAMIELGDEIEHYKRLLDENGITPGMARRQARPATVEEIKLTEYEKALISEAAESGRHVFSVEVVIDENAPMKAMRYLLVVSNFKENGDVIKCVPASEEEFEAENAGRISLVYVSPERDAAKVRKLGDVDQVVDISVEPLSIAEPVVKKQAVQARKESRPEKAAPVSLSADPGSAAQADAAQTLRVDLVKLDNLINLIGELVIIKANFFQISNQLSKIFMNKKMLYGLEDIIYNLERKRNEISNDVIAAENGPDGKAVTPRRRDEGHFRSAEDSTAKCQSNISFLESAISSLTASYDELKSLYKNESYIIDFNSAAYKLGKIINNLQTGIMDTRMVPVGQLFKRFHRVVRDLAKQQDKRVELEIHGEETELDKKVIDELGNPLTHIIRNAVDHAIESPDLRSSCGKPATGKIKLNAYHEGSNICIDVDDDGRGISSEKVLKKAIEKGIITESESASLSRQEMVGLIFQPGFSTAESVTDISGRGVGMDIVKKAIDGLKGNIAVHSEEGKGTRMTIRLPLTLAIISTLLVKIQDAIFAIPLESVIEITKFQTSEIHHVEGNKTVKIRDKILSIVELADAIGISERIHEGVTTTIVVIASGSKMIGISVDELVGKEEVVIKSLSEDFKKVEGISGASVLGDGTVSLILDVPAIIRRVTGKENRMI